jgi:hypothetical protein
VQEILDEQKSVNITTTFINVSRQTRIHNLPFAAAEPLSPFRSPRSPPPCSQPVAEDGSVQTDRWVAHVELQPHGPQSRKPVNLNLFWYVSLDQNASQSLDVQSGLEGSNEDVTVDVGGGVQPLRLTADLPDASRHPTSTWWEKPRKTATSP